MNSILEILKRIQQLNPQLKARLWEARALVLWPEAVGPQIAKHARAVRVWDQALWLEIDHPAWRSEILFQKNQILERLNSRVRAEFPECEIGPLLDLRALDPKGAIPVNPFPKKDSSASQKSTTPQKIRTLRSKK